MTTTTIEWTDEVWNPVTGCSKVSQGCKHCYAERVFPRPYPGRAFTDVRTHPDRLTAPLRWRKPRRVFVNSMSDLFHESVPDAFIDQVFAVMALAPQHTFQVLTKRPERMQTYLQPRRAHPIGVAAFDQTLQSLAANTRSQIGAGVKLQGDVVHLQVWPLPNVWLGVSVEDQETADYRIPLLLQTPAAVRWISAEPLLGPVSFRWAKWHDYSCREPGYVHSHLDGMRGIDWVVAGGESGPHARPTHPEWLRALRDQCAAADVPFFFKQWGEWAPRSSCYHTREDGSAWADADPSAEKWPVLRLTQRGHNGRDIAHATDGDDAYMQRVGKKAAGCLLDGREHLEYPS